MDRIRLHRHNSPPWTQFDNTRNFNHLTHALFQEYFLNMLSRVHKGLSLQNLHNTILDIGRSKVLFQFSVCRSANFSLVGLFMVEDFKAFNDGSQCNGFVYAN
jgi:hypothetical protein